MLGWCSSRFAISCQCQKDISSIVSLCQPFFQPCTTQPCNIQSRSTGPQVQDRTYRHIFRAAAESKSYAMAPAESKIIGVPWTKLIQMVSRVVLQKKQLTSVILGLAHVDHMIQSAEVMGGSFNPIHLGHALLETRLELQKWSCF